MACIETFASDVIDHPRPRTHGPRPTAHAGGAANGATTNKAACAVHDAKQNGPKSSVGSGFLKAAVSLARREKGATSNRRCKVGLGRDASGRASVLSKSAAGGIFFFLVGGVHLTRRRSAVLRCRHPAWPVRMCISPRQRFASWERDGKGAVALGPKTKSEKETGQLV